MLPWDKVEIQGLKRQKQQNFVKSLFHLFLSKHVYRITSFQMLNFLLVLDHTEETALLAFKVLTSSSDLYQDTPERGVKREFYILCLTS